MRWEIIIMDWFIWTSVFIVVVIVTISSKLSSITIDIRRQEDTMNEIWQDVETSPSKLIYKKGLSQKW